MSPLWTSTPLHLCFPELQALDKMLTQYRKYSLSRLQAALCILDALRRISTMFPLLEECAWHNAKSLQQKALTMALYLVRT